MKQMDWQLILAGIHSRRAIALSRLGQTAESRRAIEQAHQITAAHLGQSEVKPRMLAVIRVNESLLVGAGTTLTPTEQARRGKLADEAMDVLGQQVSGGVIHHRVVLQHDPDFEPLRDRKDFQELLEKLDRQAGSPAANR
jgi:hypothetical protein